MKKLILMFLIFCCSLSVVFAEEDSNTAETVKASESVKFDMHPIDRQELQCREAAKNYSDVIGCVNSAARAWYSEADRYYSLLHKRLNGEDKQNIYEGQKYWNLYKNFDIKVMNALKTINGENTDTEQRAILRAEIKRNIIRDRAEDLRFYYIQTFSDDDSEKIQKYIKYNPNNILIRGVRYMLR